MFHLRKAWINSAAEFAAIRFVYDQLCGADDFACSVMLLAAKLKRFFSGHDRLQIKSIMHI